MQPKTLGNQNYAWWIGADGNVYANVKGVGVKNLGAGQRNADGSLTVSSFTDSSLPSDYLQADREIDDPAASGYGSGQAADTSAAERSTLKSQITGKAPEIDATYGSLFGDLDNLLKSRDSQLETQYGDQFKKAGDQYAEAIPQIETSYTSLGAGDSTDNTYAKNSAKKGFEDTTKTIGDNKTADKAKLGQYGNETRAKIAADKDSATRLVNSAGETTDVDALRSARNDLDTNLSTAGVTRATLGTDGKAAQDLSALTSDNGRFEQATNALDSIIKSSLSGAVKQAAVQAVTDNAGLSDDEKKKVQQTYGNVYSEQAAL